MRGIVKIVVATLIFAAICWPLSAADWPEWRGAGRLGVWTDTGIVETFPEGGLTATWRTPIHGGYAGPAVADGRVFVTDARRPDPRRTAAVERILALDEATGAVLWTHAWETNYAGLQLAYAIGAARHADRRRRPGLRARGDGQPAGARRRRRPGPVAAGLRPGLLRLGSIVGHQRRAAGGRRPAHLPGGGEPDAKVIAFDKHTGEVLWEALSSDWEPGYSAPFLIDAAGVPQLIIWHPRAISSLNPATGAVYWEVPHIVDMGMSVPTPVHANPYLFVTSQWGGARMLRLAESHPDAALIWQGVGESDPEHGRDLNTLDSVISTPVIQGTTSMEWTARGSCGVWSCGPADGSGRPRI